MAENPTPRFSELSRQYGTNWTQTNVATLSEWINISAFNIRCLELCIEKYRRFLRYQMIVNMVLSTTSGTLSVSQFGFTGSESIDFYIKIVFTVFSFLIAISSGALKVYQIQERLETAIRVKNDWTVFSTNIASELQLPIQMRHDALYTIDKYKNKYLDLLKTEMDISDAIRARVGHELPHPAGMNFDTLTLSRILIDVCISEMNDFKSSNVRNRDRFSRGAATIGGGATTVRQALPELPESPPSNINEAVPESISLTVRSPLLPAQQALNPVQRLPPT